MAGSDISGIIQHAVYQTMQEVRQEMKRRTYRACNEMLNCAHDVLGRPGGGRLYGRHRASAPGQPPAVDTGAFRASWAAKPRVEGGGGSFRAVASIESNEMVGGYVLGELLENGTSKMAARPYKEKIKQQALPKVTQIYSAPY